MPHTNRRKKPQSSSRKRVEVLDSEGWTRVTTNDSSQRAPRITAAQISLDESYGHLNDPSQFMSSTAPADMTVEQMENKYKDYKKTWLESDTFKALETCLREEVDRSVLDRIDYCVVLGTGSFCGSIRGWIGRFHVAFTQLGVFLSMLDVIEQITGRRPQAYAQEPAYNKFDEELLSRFGVTKLNTPEGFRVITRDSLVYLPSAELGVELQSLVANPSIALTSKIDRFWRNAEGEACTNQIMSRHFSAPVHDDGHSFDAYKPYHEFTEEQKEILLRSPTSHINSVEVGLAVHDGFKESKHEKRLPNLDARDMPVHDTYVYFRKSIDEEDAGAST